MYSIKTIFQKATLFLIPVAIICMSSCSQSEKKSDTADATAPEEETNPMTNKGIGPVTSLVLSPIDNAMADAGKTIYNAKCTACHSPTEKLIGPPQAGVLERRSPEWVMNMILNPQEMLDKDPIAKKLLKEFNNIPMTNQGLTQEDARKVLEYMRTL